MASQEPNNDPLDETRKSYVSVARKALGSAFLSDPRHLPIVLVTGGGDGRPFQLNVPKSLDPSNAIGVQSNESACFTFFDGRDLRRVLLALLSEAKRSLGQNVELSAAHLDRVRRIERDVASSFADIEAWDGY